MKQQDQTLNKSTDKRMAFKQCESLKIYTVFQMDEKFLITKFILDDRAH